jgi:hypothetical protein
MWSAVKYSWVVGGSIFTESNSLIGPCEIFYSKSVSDFWMPLNRYDLNIPETLLN